MEGVTGVGLAAVITALTALILGVLAAIGAAGKYIVTLILDAYKAQASATADAKDREISSKDERIARIERDRDEQREHIKDQREENREQRETIRELRETIKHIRDSPSQPPSGPS